MESFIRIMRDYPAIERVTLKHVLVVGWTTSRPLERVIIHERGLRKLEHLKRFEDNSPDEAPTSASSMLAHWLGLSERVDLDHLSIVKTEAMQWLLMRASHSVKTCTIAGQFCELLRSVYI